MIEKMVMIIMCHIVGDYILSTEFIATTKGKNWYHLFVHCVTYCIPFAILFGINDILLCIFCIHIVIDSLKSRYKLITYNQDQIIHYLVLLLYLI